MDNSKMLKSAQFYISHGLSVIPCKEKRPTVNSWKEYQQHIMVDAEAHFDDDTPQIAIIAGIVSGGLEVIDFDIKHLAPMDRVTFWDDFNNQLLELSPDIVRKITIHKTQSGGYHILYRCEEIEGNKKLAKIKVNDKYECIIETRGEGGYIIAPPSPGYTNITGTLNLNFLETEERAIILGLCKSFNQEPDVALPEKKTKSNNHNFKKSPFDDYNEKDDVLNVLKSHGWEPVQDSRGKVFFRRPGSENFQSANWCKSKKIFFVFSPADSKLEGPRGFNASQVYTILNHNGDYKESYKALRREGYGTPWNDEERSVIEFAKSRLSESTKEMVIEDVKAKYPNWLQTDVYNVVDAAMSMDKDVFWCYDKKGTLIIDNLIFLKFLHNTLGFAILETEGDRTEIIRFDRENHLVEKVRKECFVKTVTSDWLKDNIDDSELHSKIMNALVRTDNKVFSLKFYEWLPTVSFNTFNDTVEFSYFFFRNGIVKVSSEGVALTKYKDLDDNTFIWKDRIKAKDFDIKILELDESYLSPEYQYEYKDKETGKMVKSSGSAWAKYIRRISGVGPELDHLSIDKLPQEHKERMLSTMSIIGYLLHSYKDPSRPWSVIMNEDTSDDGKGGGSGKQIFTKGLGMLRNLKEEDGRQLNPKAQFAFQGLTDDMDLYVLDDVPKAFKLDHMYHMITNDMVIEERNIGRKTIKFEDSPKFIFSTNYDITGTEEARHLKRRIKQLLFDCYFGPDRLPINEIGMVLKDGWDKDSDQWTLFYNYMFMCVALYLNRSVVEIEMTPKTREKAIRNKCGDDFYEFMSLAFSSDDKWYLDWFIVTPFYNDFKESYQSKMTLTTFKKNMDHYFRTFDIDIEKNARYNGKNSYSTNSDSMYPEYYKNIAALRIIE